MSALRTLHLLLIAGTLGMFAVMFTDRSSPNMSKWNVKHAQPMFRDIYRDNPVNLTHHEPEAPKNATSNLYSVFEVLSPKATYAVGDVIRVRITARDTACAPKKVGGDYFRFKLYSPKTQSSLGFDVTNDLGNGTYIVDATLRWPGEVQVIVKMVHSREVLQVLDRLTDLKPGRARFIGHYIKKIEKKKETENVMCMPKIIPNKTLCNFTDERTGYPWFCVAPTNQLLTCTDWNSFSFDYGSGKYILPAVSKRELNIMKFHKLPATGIGRTTLHVDGKLEEWMHRLESYQRSLPDCSRGQHLKARIPTGFYHRNIWYSDLCHIRRFLPDDIISCLSNRSVHLYGDSQTRQFYYYLKEALSTDSDSYIEDFPHIIGPIVGKDSDKNITVIYRFHGFPVRGHDHVPRDLISYVVNELDDLIVDARSVVFIGICTHYTTFTPDLYEKRMRDIKAAVRRLHARSPDTLVVIKNSNPRQQTSPTFILLNSDWYVRVLNGRLRKVFSDYPEVAVIDAWDIALPANFPDNVHPAEPVLKNLVDLFLSFICPRV